MIVRNLPFRRNVRRSDSSIIAMAVTATLIPIAALTVSTQPASAAPLRYSFTGAEQSWTVPAGVSQIGVDAWGGQGGSPSGAVSGAGGRTRAIVSVTPGQTLYIFVGGRGLYTSGCGSIFGCEGQAGGFNGGGDTDPFLGGSGGGGTDLRRGGDALEQRVVVAGGGGGTAATYGGTQALGGVGGGSAGGSGQSTSKFPGGGGGTQTAGGTTPPNNGFSFGGGFGRRWPRHIGQWRWRWWLVRRIKRCRRLRGARTSGRWRRSGLCCQWFHGGSLGIGRRYWRRHSRHLYELKRISQSHYRP